MTLCIRRYSTAPVAPRSANLPVGVYTVKQITQMLLYKDAGLLAFYVG